MTDIEDQMKISVIIPVFNVEKYITRCIESVLSQTFAQYEIILVDDGSKDDSGNICDRYAENNQNIAVIHQLNMGLAEARKTGLKFAKGMYVVFLDSDDWIETDMLGKLFETATNWHPDLIHFQYRRVDDEGRVTQYIRMKEKIIVCDDIKDMVYQIVHTRYLGPSACTKMIKREILNRVEFKQNLAIGEEHDMLIQLIQIAKRIIILPDAYYDYYDRKGSISSSGYNEKYYTSFKNYERMRLEVQNLAEEYSSDVNAFFHEYEMAVVTAMCRNKKIDKKVLRELRNIFKRDLKDIINSKSIGMIYKCSAVLIAFFPTVFIAGYGKLYSWGKI